VAEVVEAVVVLGESVADADTSLWARTAVAIAANSIVNCCIIVAVDIVPSKLPLIPSRAEMQKNLLRLSFLR
jgi:hypothetical protein